MILTNFGFPHSLAENVHAPSFSVDWTIYISPFETDGPNIIQLYIKWQRRDYCTPVTNGDKTDIDRPPSEEEVREAK